MRLRSESHAQPVHVERSEYLGNEDSQDSALMRDGFGKHLWPFLGVRRGDFPNPKIAQRFSVGIPEGK